MKFSLDTVRAVAQLLDEAHLCEIVVESTDESAPSRLLVRRDVVIAGSASAAPPTEAETALAVAAEEAEEAAQAASKRVIVPAPVVGFFRHAVKPVGEGAVVRIGQTVGIVESLRVPNEVTAPVAGRVLELLVQDGQGVEYHQPLLVIEPDTANSEAEA